MTPQQQPQLTLLFPGTGPGSNEAKPGSAAPAPSRSSDAANAPPSVELLLAIDDEYRTRAAAGTLPRITPKRLNPHGRSWLPVLRTERDGCSFHAMYSNTWRAHQFGRTHDWVVIHYQRDGEHGQVTVVTEPRGRMRGRRVVRGRELESLRALEAATSPRRLAG